jgi:hypothetical protein
MEILFFSLGVLVGAVGLLVVRRIFSRPNRETEEKCLSYALAESSVAIYGLKAEEHLESMACMRNFGTAYAAFPGRVYRQAIPQCTMVRETNKSLDRSS